MRDGSCACGCGCWGRGAENVAGIDEIARGFANGITFSDLAGVGLTAGALEGGGTMRRAIV